MTERDEGYFSKKISSELGVSNPPDGYCLPLAIVASAKGNLDRGFLNQSALKIVKIVEHQRENHDTVDIDLNTIEIVNVFWPEENLEDRGGNVAVRSSKDPYFYDILKYANQNNLLVVFCIKRAGQTAAHAVSSESKIKDGKLITTLHYGLESKNERPEIDVTTKSVKRDGGFMNDFFTDGWLIIFPPLERKSN